MIKYHKFISVIVIELTVRCLNTGSEDRLVLYMYIYLCSAFKHCGDTESEVGDFVTLYVFVFGLVAKRLECEISLYLRILFKM